MRRMLAAGLDADKTSVSSIRDGSGQQNGGATYIRADLDNRSTCPHCDPSYGRQRFYRKHRNRLYACRLPVVMTRDSGAKLDQRVSDFHASESSLIPAAAALPVARLRTYDRPLYRTSELSD